MKKTIFFLSFILLMGCTNTKTNNQTVADNDSLTNEVTESTGAPKSLKSLKSNKSNKSHKSLKPTRTLDNASIESIEMELRGDIGGSYAELNMDGLIGNYSYELDKNKVKRRLEFDSWNATTGRLLLRAYELKGDKYIGMFDGILELVNEGGGNTNFNYEGIFTNYKGAKTDFRLKGY